MDNISNTEQVRALVESWAAAVRANDRQGIEAHHADDVVMYDVPPPLQARGMETYRKTWDLFFQYSPGGEGSFDLVDLQVFADDTVAFCYTLLRIAPGKEPQCRVTVGLRKVKGQWQIVHEHHSMPQPIDTNS